MSFAIRLLVIPALLAASAAGADPAYAPLQAAYDALRAKDYDRAIASFRQAIAIAPGRAAIHKDLAYTLVKIGENENRPRRIRRSGPAGSQRR